MKPTDAVNLLRAIKAVCPQQHVDKFTPDAWGAVLADLSLADCLAAVHVIARRQPFISASDVVAQVKSVRARRVQDALMPAPPPELADSPAAYIAWLRAAETAVADGVSAEEIAGQSRRHLPQRRHREVEQPRRLELEAGK